MVKQLKKFRLTEGRFEAPEIGPDGERLLIKISEEQVGTDPATGKPIIRDVMGYKTKVYASAICGGRPGIDDIVTETEDLPGRFPNKFQPITVGDMDTLVGLSDEEFLREAARRGLKTVPASAGQTQGDGTEVDPVTIKTGHSPQQSPAPMQPQRQQPKQQAKQSMNLS